MTLRQKMGLQIMAMIVGLLVISGTALSGLDALHEDYGLAAAGNQELRQVFQVGSHLSTARTLLSLTQPDRGKAQSEVQIAANQFDLFVGDNKSSGNLPKMPHHADAEAVVKTSLAGAVRQLDTPPELQNGEDVLASDSRAVNTAIASIRSLTSAIGNTIEAHQKSARHKRDVTARTVAIVSVIVVLGAILVGIMQYRSVMLPLGGLRSGVRKIAAGQFAERLNLNGGEEFSELACEFNSMAAELDGFYHQLEEKVAQKSKELIRSERLASVGYLAAGVAHEINNPLGIISGYAEYSLEQLKKAAPDANANGEDLAKSLRIICDEAFRCKDITGRLLSLARQGDEARKPVCLADIADQVVSIVGGLREFHDRKLNIVAPTDPAERAALTVNAIAGEMTQVVLNLTLNALEASPSETGKVQIAVRRTDGTVELSVSDNGRGMSRETAERVFEPFFTEKRGSRSHGTGLGLSISHAIIESHGGSITASSGGVGKGSVFTVKLPSALNTENDGPLRK